MIRHKYKTYNEFLAIRKQLQGVGDEHTFRMGASEVATVFRRSDGLIGLNDYVSPTVFYYEACGFYTKPDPKSMAMLRGKIQEPVIYKEYWRHLNPEDHSNDAFLDNYYGDKKIYRRATQPKAIFVNEKYPWLFSTPDYIIQKSRYSKAGPLELKSTSRMASAKYESGIAQSYVIQNYQQMLVLGYEYGELFDVEDATNSKLYQFDKSKEIEDQIIDSTHDFWLSVLKGKAVVHSGIPLLEKEQMLAELAPNDDGNPLYTDYLKERHKPENAKSVIEGDDEQLNSVCDYLTLKREAKELDTRIIKNENEIREWFNDKTVGTIEWPEYKAKISWQVKLSVPDSILNKVNQGV